MVHSVQPIGKTFRFKASGRVALQNKLVTLGDRIKARRKTLGWSQNELARRAGVNHPTLFKIESGQRTNPSIGTIVKIARALGTTAESLVGAEPAETRRRTKGESERLATGGVALVEELTALRRRVEALEAWRRDQEGRSRRRAAR